jgi:hypothetical protein
MLCTANEEKESPAARFSFLRRDLDQRSLSL